MNTIKITIKDETNLHPNRSFVIYQLNDDNLELTEAIVWLVINRFASEKGFSFAYSDTYRLLATDESGVSETALAKVETNYQLTNSFGHKIINPIAILESTSSSWEIQLQNGSMNEIISVDLQRSTVIGGIPTWNTVARVMDLVPSQMAIFKFPHVFGSSPTLYMFATIDAIQQGQVIDVEKYRPDTVAIEIPSRHTTCIITAEDGVGSNPVFTAYFL